MNILKIDIKSILEYVIALCIILECESIWKWQINNGNKFKIIIFFIFIFCIFTILVLKSRSKQLLKINKSFIRIYLIPLIIYLILLIFMNRSNFINVLMFSMVCTLMLIYQHCVIKDGEAYRLFRKISNIVIIIASTSLIFFLFSSIIKIITPNTSIIVERNGLAQEIKGYLNLYYYSQKEIAFGVDIYRNTAIFYEAPKYALILCISLFYEMFLRRNLNKLNIIILSITILTTFSITGIILMISLIIIKLTIKIEKGTRSKIMTIIMAIFFIITIIWVTIYMLRVKKSTTSYSARIDDYMAGYKAWKERLIIGSGYGNNEVIRKYMSSFRKDNIGFSNSIFRVLAHGGVYLCSLYIIPYLVSLISGIRKRKKTNIILSCMFIFLFITVSFPYNYIAIYLISVMILE